jgi:hypothetical protein
MGSSIGCGQNGEEQSAPMSEDRRSEHNDGIGLPTQTGAIDSLEREWALLALDDGQRLDWPRDRLPLDAKEGMVVELALSELGAPGGLPEQGAWEGTVEAEAQAQALSPQVTVCLGTQRLRWPGAERFATDQLVVVRMRVDPDATDQRRREVEDLVNDLFG